MCNPEHKISVDLQLDERVVFTQHPVIGQSRTEVAAEQTTQTSDGVFFWIFVCGKKSIVGVSLSNYQCNSLLFEHEIFIFN
jgi:hypothetical protein